MKKIFRFMLVEFYVLAVLAVTTVEAKGYVERTEEKAEEQQYSEDVMSINVELSAENNVYADEQTDRNEELNNDEESNINEEINNDEESIINEESGNDTETDNNDDVDDNTRIYFKFFSKWRDVCELFVEEFGKVNDPMNSYEKTLKINQLDKKYIEENEYDFSQMKIACLGDSVTSASNLEDEENYEQYAYPSVLKELLKAEEVYNLGIGGSSIGRYWFEPFVDRYMEIPEDTDIIIVMGGYNDGFCATKKEFGSLEEREYRTFCGDLDELMKGLKKNYPDAVVFFVAPPSNSLHGFLMSQDEELLPQEDYVEVIEVLSKEYGFEFIDLYHTGFLDTYDENIVSEFVPDTTHGNHEGYCLLAERFAGEIVKYYNGWIEMESDIDTKDNVDTEDSVDIEDSVDAESGIETENGIDTEGGIDTEMKIESEDSTKPEGDNGMEEYERGISTVQ